jgi:hypothetical protein
MDSGVVLCWCTKLDEGLKIENDQRGHVEAPTNACGNNFK